MNLNLVIAQLREYCVPLQGRVGGAADFSTGTETVIAFTDAQGRLAYPSAVVIPLEDDAELDDSVRGPQLNQLVHERIGVIVEFDATADRRGQTAVDQVEEMKYALFGALLNWHIAPERSARGIYYAGGRLLDFDRARLFWQFDFALDVEITDGDGFSVSGERITSGEVHITERDPQVVFAVTPEG